MSTNGFGPNLARRVATALLVLPALVAALVFGPPLLAIGIVALAVAAGLWEYFELLAARQLAPSRLPGLILAAALFLEVAQPWGRGGSFWPGALLLLLAAAVRPGTELSAAIPTAAATMLGAVYLGALGGTIAALRILPPVELGPQRLVLLLATVMFSDTFAFFCGHALGRHRLAPLISPGKTVEGAVGGVIGGMLGALLTRPLGFQDLPLPHLLGLGALAAGLGIAGDLFESLLKRWAGVKDSGRLFPGHGGMLDRLDSLLFAAPVFYYYFYAR